MSLKQKVETDLKQAMKSRDKERLNVLRMVRSKFQEAEIAARGKQGADYQLSDEEALEVLTRYGKQRRESADSYRDGGREDLAAQEEAELAIVKEYLPEQLSEEAVREIVAAAVAESGADSPRQMGAVMKLVMPKTKGKADGKLVNQIVKARLVG